MATLRTILVTGSGGFLGSNLTQVLSTRDDIRVMEYEVHDSRENLDEALRVADVVVHLAGVNRPKGSDEYMTGNVEFTQSICDTLRAAHRNPQIIMSSSIQAELDNPYGISKRLAEEELNKFADETGAEVVVFRFKNMFGKWSRPNYNSVVATFCYNQLHGLPLIVHDREKELDLVYVDDVVDAVVREIDNDCFTPGFRFADEMPSFRAKLGHLADKIMRFGHIREDGILPDLEDRFTKCLYSTYLSYLDGPDMAYALDQKTDPRGSLAEFIKSPHVGQIFISRTKPGITRGNHYHHSKVEKFMVVEGSALIRLRCVASGEVVEHQVSGKEFRVVDIPPGYTHSIKNVGDSEMVVIFWANEVFDPRRPDTFFCEVDQ